MSGAGPRSYSLQVASPPRNAPGITQLLELSWDELLHGMRRGRDRTTLSSRSRFQAQQSRAFKKNDAKIASRHNPGKKIAALTNPVLALAREFANVFPDKLPAVRPVDRKVGTRLILFLVRSTASLDSGRSIVAR
ncbi:unnamed protein product [Peronospora belbahrii]|uniref:Uncharacterized protein n=1 Tax=Peronospora belbahrii TaxID=622444 RepID=A0AAU9KZ55_9STRA|nr:unnamed protein product [Peronospora belbahrii]CAH0477549.1 unnamed protein product [Peronospora belbahrii]